jgi:hypothetical protein
MISCFKRGFKHDIMFQTWLQTTVRLKNQKTKIKKQETIHNYHVGPNKPNQRFEKKVEEIVNWLDNNNGNDDKNSNKLRRFNFITLNGLCRKDIPLLWLLLQKYHDGFDIIFVAWDLRLHWS